MMKTENCDACGIEMEYEGASWIDIDNVGHYVCDRCDEAISEEHDEDNWPESEHFEK